MFSLIQTLVFGLVLSYGADALALQYHPNDLNNYPDYPTDNFMYPDSPNRPDNIHPDHPDYLDRPTKNFMYPDSPNRPDNIYPDHPDYPDYRPSCTYPKDKPKPVNCYFALKKYQVKEGIIVSPGSQNQKSCYECQVVLSSVFGGGVTKIKYEDAVQAVKAILTCPSGYGSIEVEGGAHERTTRATVAIEVGSGKCEGLF